MQTDYAARARALVGMRFRPHGRGEAGLDCVGLAMETYGIGADAVRRNYRLKGDHRNEIERALEVAFRPVGEREMRPGDLLLVQVARDQLHLAIRTDRGFVHAHAGLRRVVETPGFPEWPLIGAYRRRTRNRSG